MNMAMLKRFRVTLCAAPFIALLSMSSPAFADPPSRVGRISFTQGDTSFFMDADEGWRKAQINFPVTSENSIWTENSGRAEVRIGASAVRINDHSLLDFVRLQDEEVQTFLQRGSMNLRLRGDDFADRADRTDSREGNDNFRVETSEGQFVFAANGRYRIDASVQGGETRVSVFAGRARFENGDNRISIEAGKSLVVRANGTGTDFRFEPATESAFDRWAESRDQSWNQVHTRYVSERTISPYMTGYEDLDQYGDWIDDREYGRLWTPRAVVSDWAPYRYGRWSHVQPWGWTWIDDAAWGFAPFHYGRWVQVRSRWAWWPGPYTRRPAYAPALVAWFNRPGVSISISSGPSVGWFPLAPREHYLPRYSNNANYIRNINYVTNNVTIINPPSRYANQLPGATIVHNNVFHGGQQIGRHAARVPPSVITAQRPGSGADFGPRFDRRDGGNGNGERDRRDGGRDRRNDDRQPRPSFAPLPPVLPAQNVRPNQAPIYDSPQPNAGKQTPQPARGGALPVTGVQPGGFPTPPTPQPRIQSAPVHTQTMPLQNPSAPSMDSRPANVVPAAPVVPVNRDITNQSTGNDQRGNNNSQRPRRERPASEQVPTQPNPPVITMPTNRSMGDRAPQAQPQQQAPKPHTARDNVTHPAAAPVVKEKPVTAAKEPANDGRNKPKEVEK